MKIVNEIKQQIAVEETTQAGARWLFSGQKPSQKPSFACRVKAILLFLVCAVVGSAFAMSHTAATNFASQVAYLSSFKRTLSPSQCKISPDILLAIRAERDEKVSSRLSMPMRDSLHERFGSRMVDCDISAEVSDAILLRIIELGGVIKSSSPRFKAIHAQLPKDAIETLAEERDVIAIEPVVAPEFHRTNVSEGVRAHKADIVRETYGFTGRGIKVGVMSDSILHLEAVQSSGDLPNVTVLDGLSGLSYDDNEGEGTAMLEIVHDMAPGASLYFATAYNTMAEMAENILALADAGCKVIVDDVGYFAEPAFQDGVIAQAVNEAVERGCIVFSSAGNSGNLDSGESGTWEGDFRPLANATAFAGTDFSASGYDAIHDFGTSDGCNGILSESSSRRIYLHWSDPVGGSSNDYDLFLYDRTSGDIYRSGTSVQNGTGSPMEYVTYPGKYRSDLAIAVLRKKGAASRFLRIDTHRGRLEVGTDGQTAGHNGCEKVVSVGAAQVVNRAFKASDPVEDFSSDGPRRMFFTPEGAAITPGDFLSTGGCLLQKVDFTAADGVACATEGFRTFYGTSAAAPHAAAIAALILEVKPSLTRDEVFAVMRDTALSTNGWNRTTGWGIIDAQSCIERAVSLYMQIPCSVVFDANGGEVEGSLSIRFTKESGVALGELPIPTRHFHSFNGWFTAASGGTAVSPETIVSADVTYYAQWTQLPTCTIVFDPMGGTISETAMQVLQDSVVGELPRPVRSGYSFVGWFTSEGVMFTGSSRISADTTLYAHWEELPFSTGGGADWTVLTNGIWQSGAIASSTSSWCEVTVPVPCSVSFDWKTSSESRYDKLSFYVDGVLAAGPISGVMSAWSNVTYAVRGSSGTRTLRWIYSKDGTVDRGEDCGWVRDFSVKPCCTVSFDANGGVLYVPSMITRQVEYGAEVGSLPGVSRTGYSYLGWYYQDGTRMTYRDTITSDVTVYAHWAANSYSVEYELDGGTAGTSAPTSCKYDTAFKVSAPTKTGSTFAGWTVTSGLNTSTAKYGTSSSSQTAIISNADQKCLNGVTGDVWFLNLTSTANGSVTLTANWTCNHLSISLQNARAATCTMAGYTGDGVCSTCGAVVEIGTTIPALGHQEGAGVVTQEPTAEAEGVMMYSCTRCGIVLRIESIPMLALPDLGFARFTNWDFGWNMFTTTNSARVFTSSPVRLFNRGELFNIVFGYGNFGDGAISNATISTLLEMISETGETTFAASPEDTWTVEPYHGSRISHVYTAWTNLAAGVYTVRVTLDAENALPDTNRVNNASEFIFAIRDPLTLGTALGCNDLAFGTNGDDWYGTRDGTDQTASYARTKHLGDYGTNVLSTTVSGAGTLSFEWKVSSELNYDWLEFLIDGVVTNRISGTNCVWQSCSYEFLDGGHVVEWRYRKDNSYYDGLDCAWLANVEWEDAAPAMVATPIVLVGGVNAATTAVAFSGDSCEVSITCTTEGATIYYSDNGMTPRLTDRYKYTGPFTITDTATIKAIAVLGDLKSEYITVTIVKRTLTLGEAVSANAEGATFNWTTGGDAEWMPIVDATVSTGFAVQSGEIGDAEGAEPNETWIQTVVTGAGTVSFLWKVDCERDYSGDATWDRVVFYTNGVEAVRMDGTSGWVEQSFFFADSGSHTLRWAFLKDDYNDEDFSDRAWVSGFSWTPDESVQTDPIPSVAADAAPEVVTNAIASAGFVDATAIMTVIGGDASEYIAFKTWAQGVVGGEAAVVASANAAVSYLLGANRLFVNSPEIEFGECMVAADTGEVTVSITVKDGEDPVAVASSKVKEMFEATSDLSDWNSSGKKLTPTVTDLTQGRSNNLNFKVRPGDGTSSRAFLRIRK